MKSKSAFNGVVVLTLGLIIVKILSALYRVPYQNVLGDEGLYAYQQIYPIVALGVVLSSNALPSAYTQILGHQQISRTYLWRLSRRLTGIGGIICISMLIGAKGIALAMGDVHLTPMIRAASFSFLCIGALGLLRGYFQSKYEMHMPAYSQVLEQVVRVGLIGCVIVMFIQGDLTIYQAGTWAIVASTAGFFIATIFLGFKSHLPDITMPPSTVAWRRFIVATAIFAISHLIVILWQVIDSFTVVNMLRYGTGLTFSEAIMQKGIFDRGASLIQMGLIVTTTFCFVLIPLLTDTKNKGQFQQMHSYANASLKMTIVISSASGIGLVNLLPLLNRVFFERDDLTVTLSIYMLTVICVSLIMMYIALLEVHEQFTMVIKGLMIGFIAKMGLNVLLISWLGILGASIATVMSLVVFVIFLHARVMQFYQLKALRKFYLKLTLALCVMTASVQLSRYLIPDVTRIEGLIALLVTAAVGVGSIVLMLLYLNILSAEEWRHLPFGDKVISWEKGRKS
ncbi:polysaccharide biosynthesis protein [Staphylococcus lutrae]|uniref:Stage V sporulation protein B n=1 Tax=Staphylococcus lutrae TaxID=155085 RepID=A0AAC9WMJ3_9STAP|nr:polysaccharide biosynthesis protein [Staphylococcus lutrae]ARJ51047.1 stage V sporulation protein B [Staphylococcus lutrae]PNZ38490.1 polysaccharide biosynthesis protein [Staphylococcus lutrae]